MLGCQRAYDPRLSHRLRQDSGESHAKSHGPLDRICDPIWGDVPKLWVYTFLRVPVIRIIVLRDLYWAPLL